MPRFVWRATADLSTTVFAAANVPHWLQLGVLLPIRAAAGARLVPFMVGFSVLYGLACVLPALAGCRDYCNGQK